MNRRTACSLICVSLAALALGKPAWADPPKPITIAIDNMHCAQCAKKISDRLKTVVGVKGASTDVKAGTAVVTAHPNQNPSPKALWEAVERAGFKPTKLECAKGTFSAKPRA